MWSFLLPAFGLNFFFTHSLTPSSTGVWTSLITCGYYITELILLSILLLSPPFSLRATPSPQNCSLCVSHEIRATFFFQSFSSSVGNLSKSQQCGKMQTPGSTLSHCDHMLNALKAAQTWKQISVIPDALWREGFLIRVVDMATGRAAVK